MQIIRAIFDGQEIKPIDIIKTKKKTEVFVIFPNDAEKLTSQESRRLLKGSMKGSQLTEKLLKSRTEDMDLERRQ